MEQYSTIMWNSVVMNQNDQCLRTKEHDDKHFGIQRSYSRLKAVNDINLTQLYKLECLVKTKRFIYSPQIDKRKENTTSK